MIVSFSGRTEADVLLFYPSDSLREQVNGCLCKKSGVKVGVCLAKPLPEIREALGGVRLALLDATDEPAQSTDAFLQAVGQLGGYSVAVYTEQMHDGLELLVRRSGALLLLGPLSELQWEEFFYHAIQPSCREQKVRKAG